MDEVDQRRFDNQPEWLDAAQASRLIDVKRATLYAYVSRGLVRRRRGARGGHAYLRDDLLRLRERHLARAGHGPTAAGALRWGEPVLESAITEIAADGPRYRGRSAVRLAADGARFEEVAELLFGEAPATSAADWPPPLSLPWARLRALIAPGSSLFATLQLTVAALTARDGDLYLRTATVERLRAQRLLRTLAAAVALGAPSARLAAALAAPSVAAALLAALGGEASAAATAAVDEELMLSADHELNASSFTARIAASAAADLYACVGAALATMSGPRHGGASERFEALLDEVAGQPSVARAVRARAARGESLPGFGEHRLYPGGDPRAQQLLALARQVAGRRRERLRGFEAVASAVERAGGEPPTFDAALVALALALGLPRRSAAALFTVGRAAGWIAHVFEQRRDPALLRPRARYTGAVP